MSEQISAQPEEDIVEGEMTTTLKESADATDAHGRRERAIFGVPIEVTVSVGKARPLVSEVVRLKRDSVLALDSKIDDPVEIYIADRLIARGELQQLDGENGGLGVRLTEVADVTEAL